MALVRKTWLVGVAGFLALTPSLAGAHDGSSRGPGRDVVVLLPAPAPLGELQVINKFDGEAAVWIDGRFQGMVNGNGQHRYDVTAGVHDVSVRRTDTHFVLFSQRTRVDRDTLVAVRVQPPMGTLRVDNAGEVALKLAVDDAVVWISPGSSVQVPVVTGNVEVHASMKDPRGEFLAVDRTVWVEPGRPASTTLRPDPTIIVITNRENHAVHAMFDGVDAGWIGAGETRRVWVRPGSTQVVILDRSGDVRTTARLTVERGSEAKVIVQPAYRVVNTVVTTGPPRPGGPVRPDSGPGHHPDHPDHAHCQNH